MEKRFPFHEQLRYAREQRGWTQADLAEKVGCETKTVGRWESGTGRPRLYHRQALCELFGKSAEEFGLMGVSFFSPPTLASEGQTISVEASGDSSPTLLWEDWDEAPQPTNLYGRDELCDELAQYVRDRGCRVVAVSGMGGIGKTTLVATVAARMKQDFAYIFWRSLQNAPSLELILKQCIRCVSDQQPADLPENVDDQIALLIRQLQSHRCLIVLDNVESIMQAGRPASEYREGYEPYGKLIKRLGETQHQSCLVLTSREKPKEVAYFEGKTGPIRSLRLSGIGYAAGQELLKERGLFGSREDWKALVARYGGNPLALQLASEPILEVFGGDIARFLQEEVSAFGDINELLDQHFHRLSDEEREIIYWLAIERDTVALDDLRENLVQLMPRGTLLEILDSLRRRFMIELRDPARFTLQPVIMEYVTAKLVERASLEFTAGANSVWASHALIKATSKDYIRQSQLRLILAPVWQHLLAIAGKRDIAQTAKSLLNEQRWQEMQHAGYLAGNVLNLLGYLQWNLRGFDFSHLVVRQAYLQNVHLADVNFAHAHFMATVFTSTSGNVLSVACSPAGNLLAVGTTTGEIWVYQMLRDTPLQICQGHTDGVWSVAFSPDGQTLASSSDDSTIRLWDIDTGGCRHILRDHKSRVRAIAYFFSFSPFHCVYM